MFTKKMKQNKLVENVVIIFISMSMIAILTWLFSDGMLGNDFWWHVKVGEWIWENKQIPMQDIFSWYGMEKQLPWTAHEWLADVIYYYMLQYTGEAGVFFFCLGAAILMAFLILAQVKDYIPENIVISGIYFIFLAVTISIYFYGRPHLFSFFLLFFELKILYKYMDCPDTKWIYCLPIIGCLWSNLHGGSSNLAYLLCIVFLAISMIEVEFDRLFSKRLPKKAIMKLGIVSVATIVSVMINPIGMSVLTFPYSSIGDDLMMSAITEWHAPDAKNIAHLIVYFMPIALMVICMIVKEKKIRLLDVIVMAMFLYLFLRSVRFIVLWYIAAAFYAFPYLPNFKLKEIKSKTEKVLVTISLLLFCIPIIGCISSISKIEENKYIEKVMSDEAIQAVKNNPTERMYNDYNLGEALIYNDIPVFFDARADMYLQQNIFADGISLGNLVQQNPEADTQYVDVEALIEKYDFDSVLILKKRALYGYLISHEDMVECIYEDEEIAYLKLIK